MKSSLVLMITLAVLAISSAKQGGDKGGQRRQCDANFLDKMCAAKTDEMENKWMSKMSEECKPTAQKAIPQLKTDMAAACAGKAEVPTACAAMKKAMDDFRTTMGDKCGPKGGKRGKGGPKPEDK